MLLVLRLLLKINITKLINVRRILYEPELAPSNFLLLLIFFLLEKKMCFEQCFYYFLTMMHVNKRFLDFMLFFTFVLFFVTYGITEFCFVLF